MPYKYQKFPLALIFFLDHQGDGGWLEKDQIENPEPPVECKAIGWLVKEDDTRYFLMNVITSDKGYGGLSEVLKSTVTKFQIIRKSF